MTIHSCELTLAADRRELELRGTPLFPCAAYQVTIGQNSPSLPWHWHEELEVLVIRRGSLHVKLSGVDFQLRQNEGSRGQLVSQVATLAACGRPPAWTTLPSTTTPGVEAMP